MVETVTEKQQLPEAPISITVMADYSGFQVLITRRTGEQSILSQVPGIVSLVQKLVEAGFEPIREMPHPSFPTTETREPGKENEVRICPIHGVEMKKFNKGDQPGTHTKPTWAGAVGEGNERSGSGYTIRAKRGKEDDGKESPNPICLIRKVPVLWRGRINSTIKKHYAFWACPQKNPDGSFCKSHLEKGIK